MGPSQLELGSNKVYLLMYFINCMSSHPYKTFFFSFFLQFHTFCFLINHPLPPALVLPCSSTHHCHKSFPNFGGVGSIGDKKRSNQESSKKGFLQKSDTNNYNNNANFEGQGFISIYQRSWSSTIPPPALSPTVFHRNFTMVKSTFEKKAEQSFFHHETDMIMNAAIAITIVIILKVN